MSEGITDSAMPSNAATVRDDFAILSTVMAEVVEFMGARGATLTLHDGGSYPPATLYRGLAIASDEYDALLASCYQDAAQLPDDRLRWRTPSGSSQYWAAIVPVERVPGHSRLLITLIFDARSEVVRNRAEQVYRERRPFAIGFFRFWQLNRLNTRRSKALEAALDCAEIGVLLVDRSGHILFANQAAEEMLEAEDGLSKHEGKLHAENLSDRVNLSAALSYITTASRTNASCRAPLLAFKRANGPSLVATLVPTKSKPLEARDVAATVYVVDPHYNMATTLGPICQLYGLSPVETKLVCFLAAGEPLADAAVKMKIKEQTARSYLKQIFVKTATNRQTALVALMLSSLMRMKSDVLQEALTESAADQALARIAASAGLSF